MHIRDNYYATLLNIKDNIDVAINAYNREKSRMYDEKVRRRA
jgi:hypothetical protein